MSTVAGQLPAEKKGVIAGFRRLYFGQTHFDFVRRKKFWFALSSVVILAGAASLAVRGLNFDIQFLGGTSWQVPANGATVTQARNAVTPYGLGGSTITVLGTGSHQSLQVEAKLSSNKGVTKLSEENNVARALARVTHHASLNVVTVQEVGPTWGSQITNKAILALIVFFIMISLYISIFFEWKMALAAIVAVFHDILVTVGVYSLSGFLVTPDTVVAFLTVLGYSLYDTIVVFDRIRDNTKGIGASGKLSFTDLVNLSMNQTLARSINTSLVAILPILAVLVLGADILGATTLEYFGLALLIGLTSGAYSSIFIASPLVAVMKEQEPRWSQIRQRLASRGTAQLLLTPAGVAAGGIDGSREQRPLASPVPRRRRQSGREVGYSGPLRPSAARQPAAADARSRASAAGSDPLRTAPEKDELLADEVEAAAVAGSSNGAARQPGAERRAPARPAPRPRKKKRR